MFKKIILVTVVLSLSFVLLACGAADEVDEADEITAENLPEKDWSEIEELAEGTEVNFYGWGGDERINTWIEEYAASRLEEEYDIELNWIPMGPDDYLNQLLNEKEIGREEGSIDLVWINGENFRNAKENGLLFGSYAEELPNYQKYVDGECPEITYDYGHPTDGYESPWGQAQFTMTYDKARTEEAPYTFDEFIDWIKENPGQFTYPDPTTNFTGSVFVRHIIYELAGGYEQFQEIEDEEEFREQIQPALEFLKELKPYLWREGETYPSTTAQMNNMFVDGELMSTMSYSSISTSGEIRDGNFPDTARTFVLENGTIADTHYVAIPFNAPNTPGGLVLANFLLSFEAQLNKYDPDVWGDLPVFSYDKLSSSEQEKVEQVDVGKATLPQEVLDEHKLPEMPAEALPIMEEEWDRVVNQ